jgi:undecaprenyl-diphosphatase
VLLALAIAAALAALVVHHGLVAVGIIIAAQVLSQAAVMLLKHAFRRARPDHWLHIRERDLSYPSGHAVSAVVFFAGLAVLAWGAALPHALAMTIAFGLACCAAGIPWSRLALGAHFPTDILGGLLFGTAVLCIALAAIAAYGDSMIWISWG